MGGLGVAELGTAQPWVRTKGLEHGKMYQRSGAETLGLLVLCQRNVSRVLENLWSLNLQKGSPAEEVEGLPIVPIFAKQASY